MPSSTTFRQAIHNNLHKHGKYWTNLGIDILFGLPSDNIMTTSQTQFLPDNLMITLDSSNQQQQLLRSTTTLYSIKSNNNNDIFFTPAIVLSLLLIFIIALSFINTKSAIIFLNGFDGLLFFLTGVLGILFFFLWVGSDHVMLKTNLNLLWAWPTHTVVAFFVNSTSSWVKKYFWLTSAGLIAVLLSWFFLPQQMNNALLPIILLLLYRSIRRYQLL